MPAWLRQLLLVLGVLVAAAAFFLAVDQHGNLEQSGEPATAEVPRGVTHKNAELRRQAAEAITKGPQPKQILFGDLHVHTTFSMDAYLWSLPLVQGEGVHPPADACDFARFCSDLDFWAITDHAEALTDRHWRMTKDAVRRCNEVSGEPSDPDLVSFLGFEWTQVGTKPENHWGHKNVIFRETADNRVPARPIHAFGVAAMRMRQPTPVMRRLLLPYLDFSNRQAYQDIFAKLGELSTQPFCEGGIDTRELPADCSEGAATPAELFEKLDQWGFDALVIPHGTTWGYYTPPGSSLDKQLTRAQHDPERQTLFEVASGHGNSEQHRSWRAVAFDADGKAVCPLPSDGFEPCCHRAGEIIRSRCGDAPEAECEQRVAEARDLFVRAGIGGRMTVHGTSVEDWGDCDQCPDCFTPSFNYRPGGSAQHALALSNFDETGEGDNPLRFHFGFIASSDNHSARPGTGYKEFARNGMTEARSAYADRAWLISNTTPAEKRERAVAFDTVGSEKLFVQFADTERQASFFVTGGLAAVHAEGRHREAIWDGLARREVYGTSGDRILLWFDVFDGGGNSAPMGAGVGYVGTPRFRVRAVGALKQQAGCPDHVLSGIGSARIAEICRGECYNPSDERKRITRIEVVRIRPQASRGEDVAPLIEDPWKVFRCAADEAGCAVEFSDPEYASAARDTVYYVRAIEEPSQAVNGGGLRCETDDAGNCVRVRPCFGDTRTARDDDCLSEVEERAWSSPIYLDYIAEEAAP